MKQIFTCLILACLGVAGGQAAEPNSSAKSLPVPRGGGLSSKYLLLDPALTETCENGVIQLGRVEKSAANPLFGEEFPWEARFDNLYPNVIWDEDESLYKCWYNLFTDYTKFAVREADRKAGRYWRISGVCYAFSKDGIHWTKPRLAEFPFKGAPSNVIWRGAHGAGVFKDQEERDPAKRYKAIFREDTWTEQSTIAKRRAVVAAFSPDGVHWSRPQDLKRIDVQADTHNNAFWAPSLGKYVLITRDWELDENGKKKARLVARSESDDFLDWSKPEVVFRGLNDELQIYSMPVFAYAGIYLGLPTIYNPKNDRVHTELAWSRDTIHWNRIAPGTPLIGNSEKRGTYDWGCVYAAQPIFRRDRIDIYYGASDDLHFDVRKGYLALATLRPDGFAGLAPVKTDQPVTLTTVPLETAEGFRLRISADLEKGGWLEAVVLDADTGAERARGGKVEGAAQLTDHALPVKLEKSKLPKRVKVKIIFSRGIVYSLSI